MLDSIKGTNKYSILRMFENILTLIKLSIQHFSTIPTNVIASLNSLENLEIIIKLCLTLTALVT